MTATVVFVRVIYPICGMYADNCRNSLPAWFMKFLERLQRRRFIQELSRAV